MGYWKDKPKPTSVITGSRDQADVVIEMMIATPVVVALLRCGVEEATTFFSLHLTHFLLSSGP